VLGQVVRVEGKQQDCWDWACTLLLAVQLQPSSLECCALAAAAAAVSAAAVAAAAAAAAAGLQDIWDPSSDEYIPMQYGAEDVMQGESAGGV
jgi:hypothetical protein